MKKTLLTCPYYFGVIAKESYPDQSAFQKYSFVQSIVVVLFPYANKTKNEEYIPAKLFYGQDYHVVIHKKCQQLAIDWQLPDSVIHVDVSPLDEKLCAYLAGLGTYGDNNLIIHKQLGTFFAIGTIMTSVQFDEYDQPISDLCTHCGACIAVCPTKALDGGYQKAKCLSYLSQKANREFALYDLLHQSCYGCDLCQDVCFYNHQPDQSIPELVWDGKSQLHFHDFSQLTQDEFTSKYADRSFEWIGYERLLRNLVVLEAKKNHLNKESFAYLKTKTKKPWFLEHLQYLEGKYGKS